MTRTAFGALETDGTRAEVRIPSDWRKLPWPQRRRIAAQLSDGPVTSARHADEAIERELKRRK